MGASGKTPYLRLSGRAWDILRSVAGWRRRTGEGPTLGDLADLVDVSTNTAKRLVEELLEWPMLHVDRHKTGRMVSGSLDLTDFGRWVLEHSVVEQGEACVWTGAA